MKWLIKGLFVGSFAAFGVIYFLMRRTEKETDELNKALTEAELALKQHEEMLRKQIKQHEEMIRNQITVRKEKNEQYRKEIDELVEEVNRLMADMGMDQNIVDIREI